MSRRDSDAMVPKTSELLPDPEAPVKTVRRRLGISTLMSLRLFSRAPWTRMRSWRSAGCSVIVSPGRGVGSPPIQPDPRPGRVGEPSGGPARYALGEQGVDDRPGRGLSPED